MRILSVLLLLLLLPTAGKAQTLGSATVRVAVRIPPLAHIRSVTPFEPREAGECCVFTSEGRVKANTSYRLLISVQEEGVSLLAGEHESALTPGRPFALNGDRTTLVHEIMVRVPPRAASRPLPIDFHVVVD